MPRKPLPPLEVGQAYLVADFAEFEYSSALITGSTPILRLRLKNGTTLDLPATEAQLHFLLRSLCESFPNEAFGWLKTQPRRFDKPEGA